MRVYKEALQSVRKQRVRLSTTLSLSALTTCLVLSSGCAIYNDQYLRNPDLTTIKPDYPGNLFKFGKFQNKHVSAGPESFWKYLRWKLTSHSADAEPDAGYSNPVINYNQLEQSEKPSIMWMGHGTVLIRLAQQNIIIDPILTSPRLFHGARLNEVPLPADKIDVDFLLVSHGHRDHLDARTIRLLGGDSKVALVPMRMGRLIKRWDRSIRVQEASWYQRYDTDYGLNIYLLPAHHWHRRSLFDTNSVLWGSYLIEYNGVSIYVAGDTGYSSHFKEIGMLFDDIDYAVLPIGTYDPVEVIGNSHMTPEEAVFAFRDLGAKVMIPIHYGTYKLSAEPLKEPLERLLKQIETGAVREDEVSILKIGEIIEID